MLAGYQKWVYPQKSKLLGFFLSAKIKCFLGNVSAVPYGKCIPNSSWFVFPLQTISLEHTLTPLRYREPVLLGIVHYGS